MVFFFQVYNFAALAALYLMPSFGNSLPFKKSKTERHLRTLSTLTNRLSVLYTKCASVFTCFYLFYPVFNLFSHVSICFSTTCHPPLPVRAAVSRWSSLLGPTITRFILPTKTMVLMNMLRCHNCPFEAYKTYHSISLTQPLKMLL